MIFLLLLLFAFDGCIDVEIKSESKNNNFHVAPSHIFILSLLFAFLTLFLVYIVVFTQIAVKFIDWNNSRPLKSNELYVSMYVCAHHTAILGGYLCVLLFFTSIYLSNILFVCFDCFYLPLNQFLCAFFYSDFIFHSFNCLFCFRKIDL